MSTEVTILLTQVMLLLGEVKETVDDNNFGPHSILFLET